MKRAIGIDIGTTTICAVVVDGVTGEVLESKTNENDSFIESEKSYEKIQDPDKIVSKVKTMLTELITIYSPIESVGFTGQMHGILYVNQEGEARSPLYTWQDGRGDLIYNEADDSSHSKTYADYLSEITEYHMATGFGLTTHFYNKKNGLVPSDAKYLCTISDYVAMKIVGERVPTISPSNAASVGCFDLTTMDFDLSILKKLKIDREFLPLVKKGFDITGFTKEKIPVSVAIGDNQASVLGSVQDLNNTVLVNVGTGSQISVGSKGFTVSSGIELRPFLQGQNMLVGSPLCGGRAYALLEKFFREVVSMAIGKDSPSLYDAMENVLYKGTFQEDERLQVSTRFSGTRENPFERGKIHNISINNFTPEYMIEGMLRGIAGELFSLFEIMCECRKEKPEILIGSGNGIRKNKYLQKIFERYFQMDIKIPIHKEEAAYGAALFSLVSGGVYPSMMEASKIIKYQ